MFKIGDVIELTEDRFSFNQGDMFEVVEHLSGPNWIATGYIQQDYTGYPWIADFIRLVETSVTELKGIVETPRNKYMREIAPGVWIDVYDVLYAFEVTDPCLQHLIKKALAVGKRGHKDERQDLIDIRDSAIRAVEHFDKFNELDTDAKE